MKTKVKELKVKHPKVSYIQTSRYEYKNLKDLSDRLKDYISLSITKEMIDIADELYEIYYNMLYTKQEFQSIIFVDGSWKHKNPKVSGWGFVLIVPIYDKDSTSYHFIVKLGSGNSNYNLFNKRFSEYTTMRNVLGELMATTNGIETLVNTLNIDIDEEYKFKRMTKTLSIFPQRNLNIFYDYSGIESWVIGKWQTKNTLTKWYKEFMRQVSFEIPIIFQKVKAHSTSTLNNTVDLLAKNGIKAHNVELFSNGPIIEIGEFEEGFSLYDLSILIAYHIVITRTYHF